jgi:hypothetical protein
MLSRNFGLTSRRESSTNTISSCSQEQSNSYSSGHYLFAFTAGCIAGDKLACAFGYVQYGTDADVPEELKCGNLINVIGSMVHWHTLGHSLTTFLKISDGDKVCFN